MILTMDKLILNASELVKFRDGYRKNAKKVVLATGVFDILHPAHLKFLEKSREYGDVLIVGINDDDFARKKGANRPVQNEYDRAYLIAGFSCVSCVHIFDNGDDARDILRLIKPDVYIMSTTSSQRPEDRSQHELIREIGGKVIVFDAFSTTHSTTIIEKIKD